MSATATELVLKILLNDRFLNFNNTSQVLFVELTTPLKILTMPKENGNLGSI